MYKHAFFVDFPSTMYKLGVVPSGKFVNEIYGDLNPLIVKCNSFGPIYPKGLIKLNNFISISSEFISTSEYSSPGDNGIGATLFARAIEMEFPHRGVTGVSGGNIKIQLSDGRIFNLFDIKIKNHSKDKSYNKLELHISQNIQELLFEQKYQLAFFGSSRRIHCYYVKIYSYPVEFKEDVDNFTVEHEKYMEKVKEREAAKKEALRLQTEFKENEMKRMSSVTANDAENLFKKL